MRQMLYLTIKELAPFAQDIIMVTSSVTKDMNAKQDLVYRPNAIRALAKITDASMMQGVERFIKQSIIDRNPSVASAALVSAFHWFSLNKEMVKRWANEVQEAINSKPSCQYHAIGLLYQMRQHDKMAVIKMIQTYSKTLRSPQSLCLLIRYVAKIISEDPQGRVYFELLEQWLRNKNDMVTFEAARAICQIPDVTSKELFPAVSALQLMLVNHKPILRFAAVRTLNLLAQTHPLAVFPCNLDMENLITDSNRSIATFAITTLLKTGNEESVDRLMKQISGFMSEISDEFKIIVVEAIRSLCLKFPQKHQLMLNFLSGILRDEGGYEFKRAIVDAVFDIVQAIPESTEFALSHLCEFIEDCDYSKLAVRILYLLGQEGPKTQHPTRYIRYIYNRVILETAIVRAAAVSALGQFACRLPETKSSILVLLDRCTDDVDDEVRDRASMYLELLKDEHVAKEYIANEATFHFESLEQRLQHYLEHPTDGPFDIRQVKQMSKQEEHEQEMKQRGSAMDMHIPKPQVQEEKKEVVVQLDKIPELQKLGPIFKSSQPVALTEQETEYRVLLTKHIFAQHLVLQFECTNTLNDIILENVQVDIQLLESEDPSISKLVPQFILPAQRLVLNQPESIYVVYQRLDNSSPCGVFQPSLKFVLKDCDPETQEPDEIGYDDQYDLDQMQLTIGDYILGTFISNFDAGWSQLGDPQVETYQLELGSIKETVDQLEQVLGLMPQSRQIQSQASHQLELAGVYLGQVDVLARCRMVLNDGVTLQLAVKSSDPQVAALVLAAVQ
ncbi:adaptin N terminal region-domain-containing protein [Gorgonomyces haynaldii]|nr:adaptin N terminal region-domain-containing protein [Gorgonomyces haynaldii]